MKEWKSEALLKEVKDLEAEIAKLLNYRINEIEKKYKPDAEDSLKAILIFESTIDVWTNKKGMYCVDIGYSTR